MNATQQKIISFEILEKAVMDKLLEQPTQTNLMLQKQYACSHIKNREFTGKGFFTDFIVPKDIPKIQNHLDLHTNGKINDIDVGFILFINDGTLDFLEGFTYGESWPDEISSYKLC